MNNLSCVLLTVLVAGSNLWAQEPVSQQAEIDAAYSLIMHTQLGQAICRQILAGDADAISYHLGVSNKAAQEIAASCPSGTHRWIFPTRPADIRKLNVGGSSPRKYKVFVSEVTFPIESWTEPFTNTTVIVAPTLPIPQERWIRLLAHETAVYFDSKANPAHPDAGQIPSLRQLNIQFKGNLDPLVTLSNPLISHALTFIRAIQVENEILKELGQQIEPEYQPLLSELCGDACLKSMIVKVRETLLPISLPLLSFAPHYRSLILQELPNMRPLWDEQTWQRAQRTLNHLPVEFLRMQFRGDPVEDLYRVFYADEEQRLHFNEVTQFLQSDLWPLEMKSLYSATVSGGQTLLEFMKVPTLSGYNVGLSSGPRVRIRTGNVE